MLLYDRVVEVGARSLRKNGLERFGHENASRLASLTSNCPVYDLSNVTPLFTDFEREKAKRVPRRPPHEKMWAEWGITYHDKEWHGQQIVWKFRVGCFMISSPVDPAIATDERVKEAAIKYPRHYLTRMFRLIEGMPAGMTRREDIVATRSMLNMVTVDCDAHFWFLNDDGTEFEIAWSESAHKHLITGGGVPLHMTVLGLPYLSLIEGKRQFDDLWVPWPMWMAFGLMHCRNVVEEVVPPDVPARAVERSGNPPRAYSRVLRVVLPEFSRPRGRHTGTGGGPGVRFHLRSGHFKNLRHPRYKGHDRPEGNWHWWQASWAGSRDRGMVPASRPRVVE